MSQRAPWQWGFYLASLGIPAASTLLDPQWMHIGNGLQLLANELDRNIAMNKCMTSYWFNSGENTHSCLWTKREKGSPFSVVQKKKKKWLEWISHREQKSTIKPDMEVAFISILPTTYAASGSRGLLQAFMLLPWKVAKSQKMEKMEDVFYACGKG